MPVLKVNKNGEWKDIASAYTHSHTISDITDLPANLAEDIEALKDKVGAESVAYQVSTAIESAVGYEHPETHPADMISGLSTVATSGSYNDLTDLPEVGDVFPEIVEGDEGKVLGVVENTWQKMDLPKELPVITTEHNGKLLGVVDDAWAIVDAPKNENNYSDKKVVLAETNLEFTSGEHINFEPSFTLVEGEIYTVVWEGTEYPNLTAEIMSVSGHDAIGIGNKAIFEIGDDTGEPFAMGILTGGMFACYTAVAETATYSVAIYKDKPELPDITSEDNGKVLGVVDGKWQKMTIEVSGEGGNSGSSVQPDYTQNDETASDYIKNRPFYEDGLVLTEVLPETELSFVYESSFGVYAYGDVAPIEYVKLWEQDWETVTIVWEGQEYVCEPAMWNGIKIAGNAPALTGTGNNNMPFVFGIGGLALFERNQILVASLFDTAPATHKVALYMNQPNYVTLDSNYLDVPWEKVSNKPFGDIAAGTVVVEETSLPIEYLYGANIIRGFKINESYVVVGKHYNVTLNGTTYDAECVEESGMKIIRWQIESSTQDLTPYYSALQTSVFLPRGLNTSVGDIMTIKVELAEDIVAKIDSKYLPETSSGGSGECNLPEVDEGSKVSILPETKLEGFYYISNYGMYGCASSSITIGLSADDSCTVVWDGEKHTCTVVDMSSIMSGALGLGNLSFAGIESNNEPFAIGFFVDGGVTFLSTIDEAEGNSHTVEIYQGTPSADEGKTLQVVDGEWQMKLPDSCLPSVTTDDNDKFLQVVNGKWTAVTIELAEGGDF